MLQPLASDFQGAANNGNLIFRIPTPVFGGGLIEAISDAAILANVNANPDAKRRLGIGGRPNFRDGRGGGAVNGLPNTSGNDGTITRFGWKAQNKSLEVFAGEAYNVEMGVTNELFPNERDETRVAFSTEHRRTQPTSIRAEPLFPVTLSDLPPSCASSTNHTRP
jgi:CxxC motif-containing protein (DUF1111 family)